MGLDIGTDPGIFAFVEDSSRSDLIKHIRMLAEWSKFLSANSWLTLHLAPAAESELRSRAFIPAHEPVELALQRSGLRHVYSPKDVIRPIHELLQACIFEGHCCVKNELHEQFTSNPSKPWRDENIDPVTEIALLLAHVERAIHADKRLNIVLSLLESEKLEFAAQVHAVEPEAMQGFTPEDLPKGIEDSIFPVNTVERFLSMIDPQTIWSRAQSGKDLKLAILLKIREKQIGSGQYESLDAVPRFYVGADFYDSLAGREANGQGKYSAQTLDCCASAVLDLPTFELKAFRKPSRVVDNAAPLRGHISKGGAAMRLMAWKRPAVGSIPESLEFSNVGRKTEEEIIYSDPRKAI